MLDEGDEGWVCPDPPNIAEMTQEMINLVVGPEEKTFNIHRELLCHWSRYFCNALKGPFQESQKDYYKLPDVKVEILRLAFNWFYTTHLPKDLFKEGACSAVYLYIFADFYDVRDLRNCLVYEFYKKYGHGDDELPKFRLVILAFENLPENSKLRHYILDIYAKSYRPEDDEGLDEEIALRESLPFSFVLPLMLRLAAKANKDNHENRHRLLRRQALKCYIELSEETPQEDTTEHSGLVKLRLGKSNATEGYVLIE